MYTGLVLFLPLLVYSLRPSQAVNPDASRDFLALCSSKNYTVRSYYVTTADGYILNMFRIGAKNSGSLNAGRVPVLLQHGLVDSSDTWIINSEELAPGFILANQLYDVWFGNSRGNKHSRNHTLLNPDTDPEFWDFSWQDMADYDVPAQVNFVLQVTNKAQLVYIGHSQGTTQLFAHLSDDQSFGTKLALAVMLAPVGSVKHQTSRLLRGLAHTSYLSIMQYFGVNEQMPAVQNLLMYYVCRYVGWVCKGGLYLISDEDPDFDNSPQLPVILSHFPAGTSLKDLQHWSQMTLATQSVVQRFNYPTAQLNYEHYGAPTPPIFNLSNIKAPIGLFAGYADRLADTTDVVWLSHQLPPASLVWNRTDYPCGHVTFLWGANMTFFQDVLALIKQYAD